MRVHHTTDQIASHLRSQHWHEVIAKTYFPLNLRIREPQSFDGALAIWSLGNLSLSRLKSDALAYERLPHHLRAEREEQYLVTIPAAADVLFSQCKVDIRCKPGGFILERGHEPYIFGHEEANDLWVLKVPGEALRGRIRAPERFSTLQFDATQGVGALFVDMLHLIPGHFESMTREAHGYLGLQLVDLLVLALKSDERALFSNASAVREAHLSRIEQFVRANLPDQDLGPERVAGACESRSDICTSSSATPTRRSASGCASSASPPPARRSRTATTIRPSPRSPTGGASPTRPSSRGFFAQPSARPLPSAGRGCGRSGSGRGARDQRGLRHDAAGVAHWRRVARSVSDGSSPKIAL